MNNYVDMLNTYLSNVFILNNKLYNLHWNVVGPFFFDLHSKTQEYYEFTTSTFDEVAERIKMLDGYPITTLRGYSERSTIKELDSRNYNAQEVINILILDFEYMKTLTKQVAEYSNSINDFVTIDIMTKYMMFFEKQLWMLKATTK